jgi:hypothetical protein
MPRFPSRALARNRVALSGTRHLHTFSFGLKQCLQSLMQAVNDESTFFDHKEFVALKYYRKC